MASNIKKVLSKLMPSRLWMTVQSVMLNSHHISLQQRDMNVTIRLSYKWWNKTDDIQVLKPPSSIFLLHPSCVLPPVLGGNPSMPESSYPNSVHKTSTPDQHTIDVLWKIDSPFTARWISIKSLKIETDDAVKSEIVFSKNIYCVLM